MVIRSYQRLSESLLAALDLAGWFPAPRERRGILDTLNLATTRLLPRMPNWQPRPVPMRPRPAVHEGPSYLRDVYGDTYSLGAQLQKGAFGTFRLGWVPQLPIPALVGIKEFDLTRPPDDGGSTLPKVLRECTDMRRVHSPITPSAALYTYTRNRDMMPKRAFAVMPPLDTDLLELTNAVDDVAPETLVLLARHVMQSIICDLKKVHAAGAVHADVKPENFFMGRGSDVVLGDFGLMCSADGTNAPMGSLFYAAPEQFEDAFDARADIFALAVCVISIMGINPLDFGNAPSPSLFTPFALRRRKLLQQWCQQEVAGVPASITAPDKSHWIDIDRSMQMAKMLAPQLMPLLMRMLDAVPSKRPSADEVLATLRDDGLNLTVPERAALTRGILRVAPSKNQNRARTIAHTLRRQSAR